MPDGEFSVCQFFTNETHEWVRRNVDAETAVKAFHHYTNNVAVKIGGIVERVIITDGGGFTNIEWRAGKGFTYDGVTYYTSPRGGGTND